MGEGARGLLSGDRAGQEPDADEEALLGGDDAQAVEDVLVVPGAGKEALDAL